LANPNLQDCCEAHTSDNTGSRDPRGDLATRIAKYVSRNKSECVTDTFMFIALRESNIDVPCTPDVDQKRERANKQNNRM
jgi:hypothetical protein